MKKKNFVQELYPIGSTHLLPYFTGGESVALVEDFVVGVGENVLGIAVIFSCGKRKHFSWIELNYIRIGADSPTVQEVQVS